MSSYLSQFNYQFYRGGGDRLSLEQIAREPYSQRWIFLHGLMGYHLNWRRIVSGLGPNDISFVFDQRGHGKSFQPETGYSPFDYAEDLFRIVTELNWKDFLLVGHSLGGRNALVFANRHPTLIRKLIIEDIGPEAQPQSAVYYQNMLDQVPTPFSTKLKAKEFFLNDFRKLVSVRGNSETLGLYLYSNIIEEPNGQADWRFSKMAMIESVATGRAKDYWEEYKNLRVPTLVMRGAQSLDFPREVFLQISAVNPSIQTIEIRDAGHWIHYDQPDLFINSIKRFAEGTLFDTN